ncbi:MAG: hypothetical protein GXO72_03245 [Caldiserica bacterium]|nr:hypothetical protein [Caldisericota bacterium]
MSLALVWGFSVLRLRGGVGVAPWHEAVGAALAGSAALWVLWRVQRLTRPEGIFWLGLVASGVALSAVAAAGSVYLVPWGFPAGLGALFCGVRFGVWTLVPLVAWGTVALGGGAAAAGLLGGLVMAVVLARVRRAREFIIAGFLAGLASGAVALALYPGSGALGIGAAFLSGPAAMLLAWMTVPVGERFLDRTSPLTLVELLDPSHPLLERLRPGHLLPFPQRIGPGGGGGPGHRGERAARGGGRPVPRRREAHAPRFLRGEPGGRQPTR